MQQGVRTYLAQYFSDMANWYDSSSQEQEGLMSGGKQPQAGFYLSLADHIRTLPEDDLRLIALARLTGFDDSTGFSPGPRVSAAIADVGRLAECSPEPFLESLVHAALDDQLDANHPTTSILIESIEMNGRGAKPSGL